MRRAILLAALLLATPAAAETVRVIDGDTIAVRGRTIRLTGLDAPEMQGRCPQEVRQAEAARDRLAELLAGGFTIHPALNARDRWGRTLARVRMADGTDVADVLIREGHARAYDGRGPRAGWCP